MMGARHIAAVLLQFFSFLGILLMTAVAHAQGNDDMAALMEKFQNPLANIRALFTDNNVNFASGDDEDLSYAFNLQPVYGMDFPRRGFTLVPRMVIPILGLEAGVNVPFIGEPVPESVWGIGDSALQLMWAPRVKSKLKWGIGPQLTLKTRSDSDLSGPGWGGGISAVVTGPLTPNIAFTGFAGHVWGDDGSFSVTSVRPMFFYNLPSVPGVHISYSGAISYDWKAPSGSRWTIPIGLALGRTIDMGRGHALDVLIGPYYNARSQEGVGNWSLKFGVSWVFP